MTTTLPPVCQVLVTRVVHLSAVSGNQLGYRPTWILSCCTQTSGSRVGEGNLRVAKSSV